MNFNYTYRISSQQHLGACLNWDYSKFYGTHKTDHHTSVGSSPSFSLPFCLSVFLCQN